MNRCEIHKDPKKGDYYFEFYTGRLVPLKSDTSKTRRERIRKRFKTRQEAVAELKRLEAVFNGGSIETKETIGRYYESWLPLYSKNNHKGEELAPRTVEGYELIWNVHLKPSFGHIKIKDFSVIDVKNFIDQKIISGLSKETIKKQYRLLFRIVESMVEDSLLQSNIVGRVPCPVPTKKSKDELKETVLNKQQQLDLINQVRFEQENLPNHISQSMLVAINIALYTGLRLGEVFALKWSDISKVTDQEGDKHLLQVKRAVQRDGVFKKPKSLAGERDIPLNNQLYSLLMKHKHFQNQTRLQSKSWVDHDLILPDEKGGVEIITRVSQRTRSLFDRLDIPGSFHSLRHTCISNWLLSGVNIKIASTLAGHSAIAITLDRYGHVLEENIFAEIQNLYATMLPESK